MLILLTNRFKEEYLGNYSKYFSKKDLIEVLENKFHKNIPLHEPFVKFKNNINMVAFRWILAIEDWDTIIPLLIALKKNKKDWENINRREYKQIIEYEYDLAVTDIDNWDCEEF